MAIGVNPTQQSIDLETSAHDFLLGDELVKRNEELTKRFDLKEKAQNDLADAENAVVFKEISVPEFIDTVKRIAVLNKNSSIEFSNSCQHFQDRFYTQYQLRQRRYRSSKQPFLKHQQH